MQFSCQVFNVINKAYVFSFAFIYSQARLVPQEDRINESENDKTNNMTYASNDPPSLINLGCALYG